MSALAPEISPLDLSPKMVGDDITKATGDWKSVRVTVKLTMNGQAQVEGEPSASALPTEVSEDRTRQKEAKNIRHSGNSTSMRLSALPHKHCDAFTKIFPQFPEISPLIAFHGCPIFRGMLICD